MGNPKSLLFHFTSKIVGMSERDCVTDTLSSKEMVFGKRFWLFGMM